MGLWGRPVAKATGRPHRALAGRPLDAAYALPSTKRLVTPGPNCYNYGERPKRAARPFAHMTVSLQPTPTQVPPRVETWRLLTGFDLPGPLNMAIDEALLDSVTAGGVPVLRFYTWQPATLSLGTNQALGEIDRAGCAARGFGLVRRLTGGRAVLHQHELTYSVIARENDPRVSGGVVESYRKISAALVDALEALGASVSLAPPDKALLRAMSARRAVRKGEGPSMVPRRTEVTVSATSGDRACVHGSCCSASGEPPASSTSVTGVAGQYRPCAAKAA